MAEAKKLSIAELQEKAKVLRRSIIEMLCCCGSGHPGGSLSAVEIVAVLYYNKMKINSSNPKDAERDRFVLSKGHACPVLYAALADLGYFPKEELQNLRKVGSMLQGHPDMKKTPGVEASTGSLGQGLSISNGMALAGKLDKAGYRVYTLLGDGELQEGMVWEAAMAAGHYRLDNLTAIVDFNGLQIDGTVAEVMDVSPIADKFKAFGWNAIEVDGHNLEEILKALEDAENTKGKPTVIVAKTVKGKGISFMENQVDYHGKAPCAEERDKALKELE